MTGPLIPELPDMPSSTVQVEPRWRAPQVPDWRVDPANRMNLYRAGDYIGVVFNPAVAELIVGAMNGPSPVAALQEAAERLLARRETMSGDTSFVVTGRRDGLEDAASYVREYADELRDQRTREPEPVDPTRSDHTPVSMAQEIQSAMVNVGLNIRNCLMDMVVGDWARASVLARTGQFTTEQSDRLADFLGSNVAYTEQGPAGHRFGMVDVTTATGIRVTIHCDPRMTAGEVAQELAERRGDVEPGDQRG